MAGSEGKKGGGEEHVTKQQQQRKKRCYHDGRFAGPESPRPVKMGRVLGFVSVRSVTASFFLQTESQATFFPGSRHRYFFSVHLTKRRGVKNTKRGRDFEAHGVSVSKAVTREARRGWERIILGQGSGVI